MSPQGANVALQGFLTQSFSDHFSGNEFFNRYPPITLKAPPGLAGRLGQCWANIHTSLTIGW